MYGAPCQTRLAISGHRTSGVHRAERALLVISRMTSTSDAVIAASIRTALRSLTPSPGSVAPNWTARALRPHSRRSRAVPATAPTNWLPTYPARSCLCTFPCVQNANVTTGFKCAPLRRPGGHSASRLPVPANNSPVSSSRAEVEYRCIGECGPKSKHTADSPTRSRTAIPSASQAHSTRCRPPRAGWRSVTVVPVAVCITTILPVEGSGTEGHDAPGT